MSLNSIKTIYKKHISTRNTPKNMLKEDEQLFAHDFSKEIRETTISILRDVYVLHTSVFSLRKLHFYDGDYTDYSKLVLFKRLLMMLKKGSKIDTAVFILPQYAHNYFHWLTDALPRLIALEGGYPNHANTIVVLPRWLLRYSFIPKSLQLLNYQVHVVFDSKLFVKELIIPSYTASQDDSNKEIINILRDRFLQDIKCSPHRNIFISRERAESRKIVNEGEVRELLKLYDYEIHVFEDYTLEKQIEIMSQTKSLIGLHGAGLTNMLFMPKNGQILELRNRQYNIANCYYNLASDLHHDYYYQQCNTIGKIGLWGDMTVDLKDLEKNLQIMGEHR